MFVTAFLCIFLGIFPDFLYEILPYEVDYKPYTMSHVVSQMQLLCFALLAFTVIMKLGLHPPEIRAINLDSDWIYRRYLPKIINNCGAYLGKFNMWRNTRLEINIRSLEQKLFGLFGPTASFARVFSNGSMILWVAVMFVGALIITLF